MGLRSPSHDLYTLPRKWLDRRHGNHGARNLPKMPWPGVGRLAARNMEAQAGEAEGMNRYIVSQEGNGMITLMASEAFWRVNDLRLEEPQRRARARARFKLRQHDKRIAANIAHLHVRSPLP